MNFRIEKIPTKEADNQYKEANSLRRWAFSYVVLAYLWMTLALILAFKRMGILAVLCWILGSISLHFGKKYYEQAKALL